VISAYALFLATAIGGRLFCGYACPQTVYTEILMWIERKVEGDRPARMKLDAQPMNARKFRLKFIKHFLWIAVALWTGFTFVGYFSPIRELVPRF
jgi:polyferredoxin